MTIALINGSNIVNESHPKIYVITPITNPTNGKYTIDLWNSSSNVPRNFHLKKSLP